MSTSEAHRLAHHQPSNGRALPDTQRGTPPTCSCSARPSSRCGMSSLADSHRSSAARTSTAFGTGAVSYILMAQMHSKTQGLLEYTLYSTIRGHRCRWRPVRTLIARQGDSALSCSLRRSDSSFRAPGIRLPCSVSRTHYLPMFPDCIGLVHLCHAIACLNTSMFRCSINYALTPTYVHGQYCCC